VVSRKVWGDCEIVKKGFADLVRRKVYNIHGINPDGFKACTNVAKDVWDRFDVPIVEYEVRKKYKRELWEKSKEAKKEYRYPIFKSRKRVRNEEIENWLAEKYNINADEPNKKNTFF